MVLSAPDSGRRHHAGPLAPQLGRALAAGPDHHDPEPPAPLAVQRVGEPLEVKVPILLHHLKPPCVEKIQAEVKQLGNPDIGFLEQGKVYEF